MKVALFCYLQLIRLNRLETLSCNFGAYAINLTFHALAIIEKRDCDCVTCTFNLIMTSPFPWHAEHKRKYNKNDKFRKMMHSSEEYI